MHFLWSFLRKGLCVFKATRFALFYWLFLCLFSDLWVFIHIQFQSQECLNFEFKVTSLEIIQSSCQSLIQHIHAERKSFVTYVDFHLLDWKSFDDWLLAWHISVKLVPSFVPFDWVKFVSAQVETTSQVGCLAALDIFWDTHRQVWQTVNNWNVNERTLWRDLLNNPPDPYRKYNCQAAVLSLIYPEKSPVFELKSKDFTVTWLRT